MADYFVGAAAVKISPSFTGFQQSVRREFGNVLPAEATRAGTAAGQNTTKAFSAATSKTLPRDAQRTGQETGRALGNATTRETDRSNSTLRSNFGTLGNNLQRDGRAAGASTGRELGSQTVSGFNNTAAGRTGVAGVWDRITGRLTGGASTAGDTTGRNIGDSATSGFGRTSSGVTGVFDGVRNTLTRSGTNTGDLTGRNIGQAAQAGFDRTRSGLTSSFNTVGSAFGNTGTAAGGMFSSTSAAGITGGLGSVTAAAGAAGAATTLPMALSGQTAGQAYNSRLSEALKDLDPASMVWTEADDAEMNRSGQEAGEEFNQGFLRVVGKGVELSAADMARMEAEYGRAGTNAGREMSEQIDNQVGTAGETSGKKYGGGFVSSLRSALAPVAAIFAGMGAGRFITGSVAEASSVQQGRGAAEAVYGSSSGEAMQNAAGAASTYGMSEAEYLESATLMGTMGKNLLGVAEADLASWSDSQVGWAADLAATYGTSTQEALEAISSMLRGEYNPIEKYGVTVTAAMADQRAEADGTTRAMATLALAGEQSADAQGTFAAEANTYAGQMERFQASVSNLKAGLGEQLLPVLTNVATWFNEKGLPALKDFGGYVRDEVFPAFKNIGDWFADNKATIAAVVGTFVALKGAMLGMAIATSVSKWLDGMTLSQKLLNTAMRANPILIVIGVIGALVAAVIYAYQNFEGFRNVVDAVWAGIKSAISYAWNNVIKPVFAAIWGFIQNTLIPIFLFLYNNVIKPVWNGIKFAIDVAWNSIKLIFDLIKWYINNVLAPIFTWFKDSVIKPVWDWISDKISGVWNDKIKPVLEAFGDFIEDKVVPGIRRGADIIASIWDTVRDAFARPINWVIDNVWNGGIKKVFDNVAEAIGSDARLPTASRIAMSSDIGPDRSVSTGRNYHTARKTGGYTPSGLTLVGEEGPEYLQLDSPSRVYNAAQTRRMQSAVPHGGGILDGLSNAWNSTKDLIGRGVSAAFDWTRGKLADGANWLLKPLLGGMDNLSLLDNDFGGLLKGTVHNAKDKMLEWIRGKDDEAAAFSGNIPNAGDPGTRRIPGASSHTNRSGWALADRVGGINMLQTLNRSMAGGHRTGTAIDYWDSINKLNQLSEAITQTAGFGAFKYMAWQGRLWTPSGGWRPQGRGYGNDPQHRRHLHAEWLYDNGGILQPGLTLANNATGGPEYILTKTQWDNISVLAERQMDRGAGFTANVQMLDGRGTPEAVASKIMYEARRYERSGKYSR